MATITSSEDYGKFKCQSCDKLHDVGRMYACGHGRQICKRCYTQKRYDSKSGLQSNPTMESLNSGSSDAQRTTTNLSTTSSKMFPESVNSRQYLIEGSNSLMKVAMLLRPNIVKLTVSNKPVLCPIFSCRQILAVSGVDNHFVHDHVGVHRVCVTPETVNIFDLDIKSFEDMETHNNCLIVFYVDETGLQSADSISYEDPIRLGLSQTRQLFVVALAKIPIATATPSPHNNEGQTNNNFNYLFYVLSPVRHNYTYSIGISTTNNEFRFKYTGTLIPMTEKYEKLSKDCNGLVISSKQMNQIKEKNGPIVLLNLVVYRFDATFALAMERAIEMSERDAELGA